MLNTLALPAIREIKQQVVQEPLVKQSIGSVSFHVYGPILDSMPSHLCLQQYPAQCLVEQLPYWRHKGSHVLAVDSQSNIICNS